LLHQIQTLQSIKKATNEKIVISQFPFFHSLTLQHNQVTLYNSKSNFVEKKTQQRRHKLTLASAIGIGFKRLNNKVFDFGSNFTSAGSGILVKSTFVEAVRFFENSLVPPSLTALI
jgi:hypothetical protein